MDTYILGGLVMLAILAGGGFIALAIERRQVKREQEQKAK